VAPHEKRLAMAKIKIFEINDSEWVAAKDQLDAAIGYAETMSDSVENVLADGRIDREDGCPRELSASEMRSLKYHDEDDDGYGKPGYKPRSFREQLKLEISRGAKFPAYFASTEF
jgi:hypothetical protein